MLSQSLYPRELVLIHDELHYEVSRVLGQPIILMHNETGQPIAFIHYGAGDCMIAPALSNEFKALSDKNKPGFFLVTNMLFDDYIGWEIEGRTDEPQVLPPGKTFKWDLCHSGDDPLKIRICSMSGKTFNDAFWTRKQMICRPRIPLDHTTGMPTMMEHPAILGGDAELVKGTQMALSLDEEQYFSEGCPWITITPSVCEHLVVPPNMSKKYTLKQALSLVEECITNKNQRLLNRCKNIFVQDECVICLDGVPDTTITPCGHKCAHADCLDGMEEPKCPICRDNIMYRIVNSPDFQ